MSTPTTVEREQALPYLPRSGERGGAGEGEGENRARARGICAPALKLRILIPTG